MPDSISPSDRTVVVQRHGVLTYVSLAFNALILLLLLIGLVAHHHEKEEGGSDHHGWADRDGGDRDGFHHGGFGGMRHGWRHEGFGGPGDDQKCEMGGPGGDHRGFGMEQGRGWGGERGGFGMRGQNEGPGGDHQGFGGPGGEHPGFGGFGGGGMDGKTPPTAEEMTDRFMLMLTPKLSLTDAETAQVRPIIQNGIEQFQKDMEAQKQAHQKMIDDAKAKIRAVLTPDQQKQFDEMTAHMGHGPDETPAK